MMIKLKIFFVVALLSLIFVLGAFAPTKTIERFVLPDGCCNDCMSQMKCDCPKDSDDLVYFDNNCRGQLISVVLPNRENR